MIKAFKSLTLPYQIAVIAAAAGFVICLVASGVVGNARSALTYFSPDYVAEIQQTHIGVALTEQTGDESQARVVAGDHQLIQDEALLLGTNDNGEANPLQLGVAYPEKLSVRNVSSDMNEYVRLTVRKWWATGEDAQSAQKASHLNPMFIKLGFDEENAGDWVHSPNESTPEREVFYYKYMLRAGEDAATPAVESIEVDSALAQAAALKDTPEDYSQCWLALSAQVDSVQTSSAPEAARSAWGIDVEALGLDWSAEE